MKLIFAFLLLASASFAQSGSQKMAAQDIQKVMLDQAAAWNKGDIDAFMSIGYWRSENLIFVSGDKITRGWQQTLDNYKRSYATKEKMGTLTFSDLEVTLLSKDAATVLGSWSLQRTSDNPKGKFTLVFRKFKEGWRIVQDHTS